MKLISKLAALSLLSLPATVFAAGTATGTITHIFMSATYGELAYVQLSGAKSGNPACSTKTPWQFVVPLTSAEEYKVMLGILLAAQQKGATVTIVGQAQCNIDSTEETILSVEF